VSRWMERMLAPRAVAARVYEPVPPALIAAGLPE
jgi:hypothetical protein